MCYQIRLWVRCHDMKTGIVRFTLKTAAEMKLVCSKDSYELNHECSRTASTEGRLDVS